MRAGALPSQRFLKHGEPAVDDPGMRILVLVVALLSASLVVPAGGAAAAVTLHADVSGLWSQPDTWEGGRVPGDGDTVVVGEGATVTLDESVDLAQLDVVGTVVVADRDLVLRTGGIHVRDGGWFRAGAEGAPLRSDVVIELAADRRAAPSAVGGFGSGAFAIDGGRLELHGRPSTSWTHLTETAQTGSTTITVDDADGWEVGDEIVVASTEDDPGQAEKRTVTGMAGPLLSLDRPLDFHHNGELVTVAGRQVDLRAEVGRLSRNVVVRGPASTSQDGFGGHVIVANDGVAHIADAEFVRMGQAGRIGKYPIHFHMMGSAPDNWVRRAAVHDTANRCLTIHGTSGVEISETVAYDAPGHCFFFEDAAETNNRLICNLGLSTRPPAPEHRLLESDRTPATYWVTHPTNTLRGNVAAGAIGFGFWFDPPPRATGLSAVTAFGRSVRPQTAPLGAFVDNVAHSNMPAPSGELARRSGTGLMADDWTPNEPARLVRPRLWANSRGLWTEFGQHVVDAEILDNRVGTIAFGGDVTDALIAGVTPANRTPKRVITGAGLYAAGQASLVRPTFAGFDPAPGNEHRAIGPVTVTSGEPHRITGARFVGVDPAWRVRMAMAGESDDVAEHAVVLNDADGSVSGRPGVIVSANPVLRTRGCVGKPGWLAYLCGPRYKAGQLRFEDNARAGALGPMRLVRSDGVRGQAWGDYTMRGLPRIDATLPVGARFSAAFGRRASGDLQVTWLPSSRGTMRFSLPWRFKGAFVYSGDGPNSAQMAHARRATDVDGGRVFHDRRRDRLDVEFRFKSGPKQRWTLCAQRGCGRGIGSRHR